MIFELRAYTLVHGAVSEYERLAKEFGRPARGDAHGKLEAHLRPAFGVLDRIVTLWSYASFDERKNARVALAANERWNREFLPKIEPLILSKTTSILSLHGTWSAPPERANIYELRIERVAPGKAKSRIDALRAHAHANDALMLGLFTTEIGVLEDVVHLWAHSTLEAVTSARSTRERDDVIRETTSDVFFATSLSPIQ